MSPSNSSPLTRRRFITVGGGTAMWLLAGCRSGDPEALLTPATLTSGPSTTSVARPPGVGGGNSSDRVLVVIQMLGGNDALNTVVPNDGRYRDARPTLALAEPELLALPGVANYGLHPALAPMLGYWDEGSLAIAAGVAFENQTRSHFESRDIWWRATSNGGAAGWLARWIDAAAIDTPDEPMEAIALGVGPRALAGSTASAVNDPSQFQLLPPALMSDADFEEFLLAVSLGEVTESELLTAARGSLPATLSVQKILEAVGNDDAGDAYLDRNEPALSIQLQTAAALIKSRPGLRVVTVGIEGFDTHADQLDRQADLLGDTASAIAGFWDTLGPVDQARTMVMTTSEFGRRVAENGSGGTDHGNSGVQFLLGGTPGGPGVNGGQIVGSYGLDALVNGDIPTAIPGLSLYAEALRWLGGPVGEVLGTDPPATGLIRI